VSAEASDAREASALSLEPAVERLPFDLSELRTRTVRGVAINSGFLILVEGLSLAQGLIVARLLGPTQIGLYGIVSITVMTLIALKQVGIDEAYVQQDEADQELEFQRAFTLELILSALFSLLIVVAAPILVAVYGDDRLLLLTIALAYLPIAFALQAPLWIFFRRMDFVRQRSLQSLVPVVTFVVTVPLVIAGVGVWSLVIGAMAGNAASVALSIRLSPYKLKLRFEREATRRYIAFSWPILVVTACGLVINQGQVLALKLNGGLEGAGFLALALTLTRYADRADQVISPAIYPAICAVRDRRGTLEQIFSAASRSAAIWALGLGALFVLFAPDLVHFVLGSKWDGAIVLLQGLAAAAALYQFGFSWIAFARGMGRTRPPALEAVVALAGFLVLAVPALAIWGQTAFVIALGISGCCILVVRAHYIRELLPGVPLARLASRAVWPLFPAAAAALAIRFALWGGHRSLGQAIGELVAFLLVYAGATFLAERGLARDLMTAARAAPEPGAA
jgi:O-antigen/teichoic acid export membrane protein